MQPTALLSGRHTPQHPRACATETDNAGSKNANDVDDEDDNKRLLRIYPAPAAHAFSPSILTTELGLLSSLLDEKVVR